MNTYIIRSPRLFIPKPTGFTLECRTYGIRVYGYNKLQYDFYKGLPTVEKPKKSEQEFYDFISFYYDMDLSSLPSIHPYVQYVDYMKKVGGGIAETDANAIEYLKKNCNTLIIPDAAEREIVDRLHNNTCSQSLGFYKTEYKDSVVPERFLATNFGRNILKEYYIINGRQK